MSSLSLWKGVPIQVSNFPAIQAVSQSGPWSMQQAGSWSVSITNFPAVQVVSVNNFPAVQAVSQSGIWTVQQGNGPWSQNLTQISGSALTLGLNTTAASIPVTLPSDMGVASNTGSITNSGDTVALALPANAQSVSFIPTGTAGITMQLQFFINGAWFNSGMVQRDTMQQSVTTLTTGVIFEAPVPPGATQARIRANTTGTTLSIFIASNAVSSNFIPNIQPTNTSLINGTTVSQGAGPQGAGGQRVVVAQDPTTVAGSASVPVGTNVIGKVGIDQTTPGVTNLVNMVPDIQRLGMAGKVFSQATGQIAVSSGNSFRMLIKNPIGSGVTIQLLKNIALSFNTTGSAGIFGTIFVDPTVVPATQITAVLNNNITSANTPHMQLFADTNATAMSGGTTAITGYPVAPNAYVSEIFAEGVFIPPGHSLGFNFVAPAGAAAQVSSLFVWTEF